MTTHTHKTVTAVLNPDEWVPVTAWLSIHRKDQSQPGLFIEDQALPGIRQMTRKARLTNPQSEMRLRLRKHETTALLAQMRFWETAMDELARRFRENAPVPGHFACMASSIEDALNQAYTPAPQLEKTPVCTQCGKPLGGAGQAVVDIDRQGNTLTASRHL